MGRNRKFSVWMVAGAMLAAVLLAGGFVAWRASQALLLSTSEVRAEHEIRYVLQPFDAPVNVSFEPVRSPEVFLQAARFQDHLYIAGPAGLSEYDLSGLLLRQFAVGRDMPSASLVALTVGIIADSPEPELIVATAGQGILLFNGRNFRQILPLDRDARSLTCLLPVAAGHLLFGTKKRGVLLFDGKEIRELHPTLAGQYVSALAGSEVDLWVGTLENGALHWHSGTTEVFGEAQGLPDRQVQAISLAGDRAFVGTPLGVAEFDRGQFSRTLGAGLLTIALLALNDQLLVGTQDQGVVRIPLVAHRLNPSFTDSSGLDEVKHFLAADRDVYALTRNGMFQLSPHGAGSKEVLKPAASLLSDRNISALAKDKDGQLWIGYFDRGLDLLSSDAARVLHVENQHVFCVNRIWPDEKSGIIHVATANGLVQFTTSGIQQQVLTKADGLIADHVTDVVPYGDGMAIATPAGLTFLDSAGARSMYAFHGLVNNHVYTLGVSGDQLMVGTLGGLSLLGKGEVLVNYTAGVSGLKQNWITAVARVGEEWMVGTYGSGVVGLDRAGHFHSFEKATAPMEINSNAMLVTPRHVLVGTLGKGLYVYDREAGRWSVLSEGLPSENVTALAESNGYLYVGTDNGLVRIQESKLHP
jgi:hypothetical protein